MEKIIIATRNQHKFKEITQILSVPNIEFISINEFTHVGDVDETGKTFVENAAIKAIAAYKCTNHISIADDSGLEIEALDNKPGINSSRFMGEKTDYKTKNNKILELLRSLPDQKRTARFVCAVAICFALDDCQVVIAACEGQIGHEIRGENGFGYDPIFFIPEYQKTFAELSNEIKNQISHRGKAFKLVQKIINKHIFYSKGL
ncbi:XTP/dITP diphosphatase [Candidatus Poribacteria bacterium]|nr:XTP/dITP diphosphatase [Candidatus Poribacteria bacterium]